MENNKNYNLDNTRINWNLFTYRFFKIIRKVSHSIWFAIILPTLSSYYLEKLMDNYALWDRTMECIQKWF